GDRSTRIWRLLRSISKLSFQLGSYEMNAGIMMALEKDYWLSLRGNLSRDLRMEHHKLRTTRVTSKHLASRHLVLNTRLRFKLRLRPLEESPNHLADSFLHF